MSFILAATRPTPTLSTALPPATGAATTGTDAAPVGFAQLLDAAQPANPGKTLPSAETTEAAAAKPVRKAQHNAADAGKTSRSMAIDIAAAAERAEAATSQVAPATAFEAPTVQADPVVDATAPAGASAEPRAPALDASLWLAAWAAAPRAARSVIETPAAQAVAATAAPEIDANRATAKPGFKQEDCEG